MYLLDTNIILELMLNRGKAHDVARLFRSVPAERLFISEFSLYSIGIIFHQRKTPEKYLELIDDLIIKAGVHSARLLPEDMRDLSNNARDFSLDFDDAYQYTASEKYGLTLVSFDADFDRTPNGRKKPDELV